MIIETERLILRPFKEDDGLAYATINADPDVMRFYPAPFTRQESDASIARAAAGLQRYGYHFLAAELEATGEMIGIIGIAHLDESMRATLRGAPEVEIGWRLAQKHWGQGLATEGARACLTYGFEKLDLPEIVAFTYEGNQPSRRVMEKIGMARDPSGDFVHNKLPADHKLSPHVLYRISNPNSAEL